MRKLTLLMLVAAPVIGACGKRTTPVDEALKNDLALAAQAQAYSPQQFMSPEEAGYGAVPPQYAPRAIQTVARQPAQAARRTPAARRSSGGGNYPSRDPGSVVVKNTHRDAVIGAAAGAILGAATSRDKVKGGLIGAAAGGLLGAVIGNNVDVQRRP